MALIVYELDYGETAAAVSSAESNGVESYPVVKAYVSKVDVGDRVQFKANHPNAAIKFTKETPFEIPKSLKNPTAMAALKAAKTRKELAQQEIPVAGVPFPVGKKTAEFKVVKAVPKKIRFKCGTLDGEVEGVIGPKFIAQGKGGGIPSGVDK